MLEVVRSKTRIPGGKNGNPKERVVNNFRIQRASGVEHFKISNGKEVLKCPCHP